MGNYFGWYLGRSLPITSSVGRFERKKGRKANEWETIVQRMAAQGTGNKFHCVLSIAEAYRSDQSAKTVRGGWHKKKERGKGPVGGRIRHDYQETG